MSETRAVMLMVPPLLADLIRRSVKGRLEAVGGGFKIVSQLNKSSEVFGEAIRHAANIVIIGPQAVVLGKNPDVPEHVNTLRLSPDLRVIYGPGATEQAPFTPDALAEIMRKLSR